jgi:hypothetical protein
LRSVAIVEPVDPVRQTARKTSRAHFRSIAKTIPALAVELCLRGHQGLFQQISEDGSTPLGDDDGRRDD